MKHLLLALSILVVLYGCKKDGRGKQVEIYLLKSFQLVPQKCQVDAATAVLQDEPLVSNSQILQYDTQHYEFYLSDVAYQKVKTLMARTPFAVTVDRKVVYYGIYMPSFLSSTCDNSITMDVRYPEQRIYLRLGYPWMMSGNISDERNSPVLMVALRNQGKLR